MLAASSDRPLPAKSICDGRTRKPISEQDQAELNRFAAFLSDPDPDRAATYLRHYSEELDQ